MQRLSDIPGKPIVSAEDGSTLGVVADLLLDSTSHHVVGLVTDGGLLHGEHVLPFADVQTFGVDAVIARTASGVLGAKAWRARDVATIRSSSLHHRRVVTTRGRELGRVRDLLFEDGAGNVASVEIESGGFAGLMQRRYQLPYADLALGPDALVIDDAVALQIEEARATANDRA